MKYMHLNTKCFLHVHIQNSNYITPKVGQTLDRKTHKHISKLVINSPKLIVKGTNGNKNQNQTYRSKQILRKILSVWSDVIFINGANIQWDRLQ